MRKRKKHSGHFKSVLARWEAALKDGRKTPPWDIELAIALRESCEEVRKLRRSLREVRDLRKHVENLRNALRDERCKAVEGFKGPLVRGRPEL